MNKEVTFEKINRVIDRIAERQEKTDQQTEKTHQEIRELRASQAKLRCIHKFNPLDEMVQFTQPPFHDDNTRRSFTLISHQSAHSAYCGSLFLSAVSAQAGIWY